MLGANQQGMAQSGFTAQAVAPRHKHQKEQQNEGPGH